MSRFWQVATTSILKIQSFLLGMLIFRQKSFQFCTPHLKTQQPVLPYSKDSSTMTEQEVVSRSFKSNQTTSCHAFPDFFTPELVISLNTSSIYMKAWFRSSFLRQNLQKSSCLSRAICEADNEVVTSMKSPIAHVLSEVLRLVNM